MFTVLRVSILFSVCVVKLSVQESLETKVADLVQWYNKRSQEASIFEFPTDARMYKAEDTKPQGS